MLTLGGDHYISLPLLRAHAREHGPLALIHFDAHTDTYEQGTRFDHGTIFHHALQEGLVVPEHSLQIGIRTSYDRNNHPYEVLDADWVNDHGPAAVLERIRARVGHHQPTSRWTSTAWTPPLHRAPARRYAAACLPI
ncbi:hypothetical protein HAALTHF_13940n [Vreelandella aquamarina]|nr:hypothetical protein HAALTHF_13940n [Halomonas axialensis]